MKQETALDILKSGYNVFITGSAGTGKTYLLNQYIQYLRDRRVIPAIVAPTGIAASHLKGQTIHSFFGIGIREVVDNIFLEQLLERRYLRIRFSELEILIIDEISMVSPELFLSMDRVLKAFRKSNEPFGGIQVVVSGDFFQLPPVSKVAKEKRFAWQSPSWRDLDFRTSYLEIKFRQDDDKLITVLDDIRRGIISDLSYEILNSRHLYLLDTGYKPTRLYTHNFDVDRINNLELRKLNEDPKVFRHTSKGSKKNIDKIFNSSLVLEDLILKKGAVVIFIKNSSERGYVNGTNGVVIGFTKLDELPIVQTASGEKIFVGVDEWSIENDHGEIIASISQIPLRLAWAMTIHKSQGMTLDTAEIDLSKTFEVGQGYVALSRLKSIEGLRLMGLNNMALRVDPLILKIDDRIKSASKRASEEIGKLSYIEKIHKDHILKSGGEIISKKTKSVTYDMIMESTKISDTIVDFRKGYSTKNRVSFDDKIFIEDKKVEKDNRSIKIKKISTYIQTKNLIDQVDSIEELAKIRDLKEGTIIGHLSKLKEKDDSLDLEKFRPDSKEFKITLENIKKIKATKNEEYVTEDGKLHSYFIFNALNREVSHEEIKLAILFV